MGWDSLISTATPYSPNGPRIKFRLGGVFLHTWCTWGSHSLLYNGHRVYFSGAMGQGHGLEHSPPSSG